MHEFSALRLGYRSKRTFPFPFFICPWYDLICLLIYCRVESGAARHRKARGRRRANGGILVSVSATFLATSLILVGRNHVLSFNSRNRDCTTKYYAIVILLRFRLPFDDEPVKRCSLYSHIDGRNFTLRWLNAAIFRYFPHKRTSYRNLDVF